jgi:acyl carrier protein
MIDTVRQLIDTHGNLRAPALILTPDADLYAVGLTPFAAIKVTLALEETFDVEFPARMLRPQSFASINSIVACLDELRPVASRRLEAA